MSMIRSYWTVAIRNLLRQKGYTLVNVSGLAVGFACVILIGLYVKDELSFDWYHEKADRTYRVVLERTNDQGIRYSGGPPIIARVAMSEIPGVETAVRRYVRPDVPVVHNGRAFPTRIGFTDTTFFDVFDFVFLSGDPKRR